MIQRTNRARDRAIIKNIETHFDGGDLSKLGEHVSELLLAQLLAKVLDEDVGELLGLLAQLLLALLARNEAANVDL